MARMWRLHTVAALGFAAAIVAAAHTGLSSPIGPAAAPPVETGVLMRNLTHNSVAGSSYHHVWPPVEFGWRIVLGSLIGFFGAAFGSVGGVGGGGIFVPMLALIIGFDPKSSAAVSKCMIMGASVSTVYCNLKLKHPTLDMPLIDYDLALLIQPMLMLGVSIGVIFNVIFPDWLVTVLLIILFLFTSTKSFLKGVQTWKKETIAKKEAAKRLEQICHEPEHVTTIPTGPAAAADVKKPSDKKTSVLKNIYWKEFGLLAFVWMAFLALQVAKNYTTSCSALYWVLNSLQIPVAVGVTMYEAHGLMTAKRVISSKGSQESTLKPRQLFVYCLSGIIAGLVGGLLGLGGGFIMGPLFLELGVPPQVSSATSTFAMMFSSSMSVVEYYLLHRFPVPYGTVFLFHISSLYIVIAISVLNSFAFSSAAYFVAVAFSAAIVGQHCVRKLIVWLGRASLIIFILASMIFVSALTLGTVPSYLLHLGLCNSPKSEYLNNVTKIVAFYMQVG
ncbi:hypothetical protein BAE44_0000639 [Dichanthelium oligosanthes]|uniref:Sulfite exporter TauE/SafE family protein 3 n=1 Tax=Dichanthelium oligosanthes TaxID=888268 RepID=A0A1E5WLR6_9POAL|nr:hypothetical protein BAE44_0000639 [Dichanthelium oligosanthes]